MPLPRKPSRSWSHGVGAEPPSLSFRGRGIRSLLDSG